MAYKALNKETEMIWARIRADGRIVWRFCSEYYGNRIIINAEVYARLLRDVLPLIYEPGHAWLQDGFKVHTAHLIRNLMMEYGVWLLPHPVRSPDLNVIENFWFKLKETVHRLHSELVNMEGIKAQRKEALKQAIRDAMAEFEGEEQWELSAVLAESMPRRFTALRAVGGVPTKY